MRKTLFLAAALVTGAAHANLHLAPPDFNLGSQRAVFVDITHANYSITYDSKKGTATARSELRFTQTKKGYPLFDLVPVPRNLVLNGTRTTQRLINLPGNVSKMRLIGRELNPGDHVVTMEHNITANTSFSRGGGVRSAFWIRDLTERKFLEQYLPGNLEFDQHSRTLEVNFTGKKNFNQELHANGGVAKTSNKSWRIEFPAWYTSACVYFHTYPKGAFSIRRFTVKSIDGRDVPFTTYSGLIPNISDFSKYAVEVFHELEKDYGPWPHPFFIAYGAGRGGMEHAGATMTSIGALDHEMLHSYFAKGVMPANGNSGWIDEGIARWRDNGYNRSSVPGKAANLAGHSPYQRNTDDRGYAVGSGLFAYLDWMMQDKGGLKPFLRGYFQTYKYTQVTTEHLKNNLEFFSGLDLTDEFDQYIYGKGGAERGIKREELEEVDHAHVPVSDAQLKSLI